MPNVLIVPNSGFIEFNTGATQGSYFDPNITGAVRLVFNGTGGIGIEGNSTGNLERFYINGSRGRLFTITDANTGVLFAISDQVGSPIFEVHSDDRVYLGTDGENALVVSGVGVAIGTNYRDAAKILYVSGDTDIFGNLTVSGSAIGGGGSNVQVTGSSNLTTANLTGYGTVTLTYDGTFVGVSGTAGASADTASNLGGGSGLFYQKNGADFEFKSISVTPSSDLEITGSVDQLGINFIGSYATISDIDAASGVLRTDVDQNTTDVADLKTATGTLRSDIDSNDTEIAELITASGYLDTNKVTIAEVDAASGVLRLDITDLQTASGYLDTNKIENADLVSASGFLSTRLGDTGSNLLGQIQSNDTDIADLATASGYLNSNKSEVSVTGSSNILSPNLTGLGTVTLTYDGTYVNVSGTAGASADTASNLGAGSGLFFQKNGADYEFKSISVTPSSDLEITGSVDQLGINFIGSYATISDIDAASGVLRTDITDLQTATGTLSTVSGALRTDISQLQTATGVLSSVSGALTGKLWATSGVLRNSFTPATGWLNVHSKTITVESPASGDAITMFYVDRPVRMLREHAIMVGTTNVSWDLRTGTSRSAGARVTNSAGTVANSTTGLRISNINQTIATNNFVWLNITGVTDAPDEFSLTVFYSGFGV